MKIGLMLGGGGVFGAYQLGVIKALAEEKLLNQVQVISGVSIGAINTAMILTGMKVSEMECIWELINNEIIFKGDNPLFKDEEKSLIDTSRLYNLVTKGLSIKKIHKSKVLGYATLKEVESPKIINQINYFRGKKVTVLLNEAKNPFEIAKASSSIPMLFGTTKIDDKYYVDGGYVDNNPMDPLLENKCDIILAVPLTTTFKYKRYEDHNITIIDFKNCNLFSKLYPINILKSVIFTKEVVREYQIAGYSWAKYIIAILKKLHIIVDNQFKIDTKEFTYYNLEKLEREIWWILQVMKLKLLNGYNVLVEMS